MNKRPSHYEGRPVCARLLISISLLCLFLFSCSRTLDRQSYVEWVRDYKNGLHVSKTFGEFTFDVQYQPQDLIFLQRVSESSTDDAMTRRNDGSPIQYYLLKISAFDGQADLLTHDVANETEKQQKLYYLSYQFQDDLFLEEKGELRPCALYHFERSSVTSRGERTFVLGFEGADRTSEEATLVIKSDVFSSLPIKIKVSKNNIPSLAI
jgi:hypothetical protein